MSAHGSFEAHAERTPDAVAFVDRTRSVTYGEANARANRLAHRLIALGVGTEDRVGVWAAPSIETLVGILAVLKAGAAYVPIDPKLPRARQLRIVEKCGVRVSLAAGPAPELAPVEISLDAIDGSLPATNPGRPFFPEQAMVVLHTSGSTGEPKSVLLPHRGPVSYATRMRRVWEVTPGDRVLQFASLAFDASLEELLLAWTSGAAVVVRDDSLLDPRVLLERTRQQRITILDLPSAYFGQLVRAAEAAGEWPEPLRLVIIGGERAPAGSIDAFHRIARAPRLFDTYGPTEASICVTFCDTSRYRTEGVASALGEEVGHGRVHVLDDSLAPVPVGVEGQICVSEPALARGYLGAPAETAAAFVPDPFTPGGRLYLTGDRGRRRADGSLEFLGRRDEQIKIRGFRVEPAEVEAALAAHDDVAEAVVVASRMGTLEARLVAYVRPPSDEARARATSKALRAFLAAELPAYMVPSAVVLVDAWPLTTTGKVDRRALPQPDFGSAEWVAPRNALEEEVCRAFADVLGLPLVGIDDDFFALGGNSLLVVRLLERLRALGHGASVADVFASPTVAALAPRLSKSDFVAPPHRIPLGCRAITPDMLTLVELDQPSLDRVVATVPGGAPNVQDVYPLTPLQEGMLFEHLAAGDDRYVTLTVYRCDTLETTKRFLEALQAIVSRYDILRTSVVSEGLSRPVQVVHREARLPVEWCESEVDLDAEALIAAGRSWRRGFDLSRAPLLRARVTRGPSGYAVLVADHHVAGDHTVEEIVAEEIAARMQGVEPPAASSHAFRSHVAYLASRDVASSEGFWREHLRGISEPTVPFSLGLDDALGAHVERTRALDGRLAERVAKLCRELLVSQSALFHAAYALALGRCSGASDVVFGTMMLGRSAPLDGVERAAGMFLNALPMRLRLARKTVRELVTEVHGLVSQLLTHEHVPLSTIRRWSDIRSPLPPFASSLNYRHNVEPPAPSPGAGWRMERREELATHPFVLTVDVGASGIALSTYAPDELGRRFLEYVEHVLAAMTDAPDESLDAIEALPPREREEILERSSGATIAWPTAKRYVHELVEEQAKRTPRAVALVDRARSLSYEALIRESAERAAALRARGIGVGDRVAVSVERSVDAIVAMLAIFRAGATYVPVATDYPTDRTRYVLDDAAPKLWIVDDPARAAGHAQPWVAFAELVGEAREPERLPFHPALPAYVIYTSGSTGRPKGTVVPHGGIPNLVECQKPILGFGPGHAALQFASLGFDASVWEVLGALVHGSTLVVARDDERDASALKRLASAHEVAAATLPPSMLRIMLAEEFPSLRHIVSAGEALDAALAARWADRHLVNAYGPTEFTVCATETRVLPGEVPTIGRPLANTRAYVLDDRGRLAPPCVAGDLFLAGVQLAQGYLGQPALTAERFVPDPFGPPGSRMYRTGDRARFRLDGKIEFLGRADHQVKIHGHRIELGEIEAHLASHPLVEEAVVVVRDDALLAFLTAKGAGPSAEALREHLAERLPAYMVPSAFAVLEELPLTPNGKIDRAALVAHEPRRASEPKPAFSDPLHQSLASIWMEVLHVESVGPDDNFFDLGGHSLPAMDVVARASQLVGFDVPLAAFLEHPTIAGLAEVIAARRELEQAGVRGRPPLVAMPRSGPLPLSLAQEGLWLLDRQRPGTAAFNMPLVTRLTGALDVAALSRALSDLVLRHEALRTTFAVVGGAPVQVVAPAWTGALETRDVRPEQTDEAIAREISTPFDLARGPLFRALLLRESAESSVLVLTIHHIVSDGWSLGVITRELAALYAQHVGRPLADPLAPVAVPDGDWALWQRSWLSGEALERQLAYWKSALADAPARLELPADRSRERSRSFRAGEGRRVLSAALSGAIRSLAAESSATPSMVLFAAFGALLGRLAGQSSVVVGCPVANRIDRASHDLVGFLVNVLALRVDASGAPTVRELLARVRRASLEAYENQDVPLERVQQELDPGRDRSGRLVQVMLNVEGFEEDAVELSLPGLRAEPIDVASPESKFELTLYVRDDGGRFQLTYVYDAEIFDAARIDEMADQLEALLAQATAAPDTRVADLSLVTPKARALLPAPDRQLAPLDASETVLDRVVRAVARFADRIAVGDVAQTWTYAELDRYARRIGLALRARGVGAGDLVAIYGHRGAPLVASLLGVLHAGAAFTVLDSADPAARLAAMLGQAPPRAWLELEGGPPVGEELRRAFAVSAGDARLRVPARLAPDWLADVPQTVAEGRVDPSSLAYVVFTSGTTGVPKAIATSHEPLAHFVRWHVATFGFSADDRFSMLSGLSHDPLLRDVFAPLSCGASIHVPDPAELLTPGYLARWMREAAITAAHLTPPMSEVITTGAGQGALPALRRAFFGGDRLHAAHVSALRAVAPSVECVNFYGTSETPQAMAFAVIDGAPASGVMPLGKGIDDVELLVLDARRKLAGIGELGEIHVRTRYLARGYLGDHAGEASARFRENPWTADPGDRIYATGDLGRYGTDGQVHFVGRADAQVKIRGFRVELGDVEAAIRATGNVRACAVVAHASAEGAPALVAYVTPADADVRATRARVAAMLPEPMTPSEWVTMDELPLTANGKIDRKALPAPIAAAPAGELALPRTELEKTIARVWESLLGAERVGLHDNFFELGGHSLLAVRMLATLKEETGREVPFQWLFDAPTVAELAERLESTTATARGPTPRHDEPARFAMTSQQRLIHEASRRQPRQHRTHHKVFRLRGALEVDAMRAAFDRVAARHALLSAVTDAIDGKPALSVARRRTLDLVDLAGRGDAALHEALGRLSRQPDLSRLGAPLTNSVLYRIGPEEHVLFLQMHTLVADMPTWRMLESELWTEYAAVLEGRPALPRSAIQFADVVHWEAAYAESAACAASLGYWRERLSGAQPLRAFARGPLRDAEPHVFSYAITLTDDEMAKAGEVLQRWKVTPAAWICAVYATALAQWSGQRDPCILLPSDRRLRYPDLGGTFGNMINASLLRVKVGADDGARAACERALEALAGAAEHGDVPLEAVLSAPAPSLDPLAQSLLVVFQPNRAPLGPPSSTRRAPIAVERVALPEPGGPRAGVTVMFTDAPDVHEIYLGGSSEWVTQSELEELATRFAAALGALVDRRIDPRGAIVRRPIP